MIALVVGGGASGKSAFAEELVCALAKDGKKRYLATMPDDGPEAEARIARHRAMRTGKGFETAECPAALPAAQEGAALLESLSGRLANAMFSEGRADPVRDILAELDALAQGGPLVVVSDDIFSGGEKFEGALAEYADALAALHRALAARAELVVEVVCSVPVVHKGRLP